MSIEEYIYSIQAEHRFSNAEWSEITQYKQSVERVHPDISEINALTRAVEYVSRHRSGQHRQFYKSEFVR